MKLSYFQVQKFAKRLSVYTIINIVLFSKMCNNLLCNIFFYKVKEEHIIKFLCRLLK